MKVPVSLKVVALTLISTGFYTVVGQLVPQKEVHPPEVVEMSADMTTEEMVAQGREIFNGKGICATCHQIGGSGPARFPDLEGIATRAEGRVESLSGLDYLAQSLYEPNTYIVPGFVPGMPQIDKAPIGLTDDEIDSLPDLRPTVNFGTAPNQDGEFWPFLRDPETLARPWALPGTPGLEHRIGGLEKADGTGNISYDPENHHHMTELRAAKIDRIADTIPPVDVDHVDGARLLVLGWGSTYGPIRAAVRRSRADGNPVAVAHLRHLNPFPRNLGEVLRAYDRVLVPEMNSGQLRHLLRAEFLVDVHGYNRVKGLPFTTAELVEAIAHELKELA